MIKVAICDKDTEFADNFSKIISEHMVNKLEKLDKYTSLDSLFRSSENYDLVFVDTYVFELNEMQAENYCSVSRSLFVFVTNDEKLIYKVFNSTVAFGFIRKCKAESDFYNVIEKFYRTSQANKFLRVRVKQKLYHLRYSEIIYIEKTTNYVIIHTIQEEYKERATLSEIEEILSDYGFIRPHTGYIVNLNYIFWIKENEIILSNNTLIPINRKRTENVTDDFVKHTKMMINFSYWNIRITSLF